MPPEPLDAFFAVARDWVNGRVPPDALRALGPTPSSDADLDFYPGLVRLGYHQTLTDLMGPLRRLLEHAGIDWAATCDAFLADHPPAGHALPTVAFPMPAWLAARFAGAGFLDGAGAPTAQVLEAVAELCVCKVRARHAPDGPVPGFEVRTFVRRFPVDPAALAADPGARTGPTTVCVYRDVRDDVVRTLSPGVEAMAVFAALLGVPRTGALALPAPALRAEVERLVGCGLLDPGTAAGVV